jgi:nucleotide-binding universal stress UspA family protein
MRTGSARRILGAMTDHNEGYRHIVVGVDGGDEAQAALAEALRLARASKGQLDVLVAVPEGAARTRSYAEIADAAAARAGDLHATTYLVDGDPAEAILRHADREHCDLIVLGCRSRVGPNPATSASTTTAVSERSRVPVLMVRRIAGDDPPASGS